MKRLGLYIHIPFCKSKCLYCDFNSYAGRDRDMMPYFSALLKEAKAWSEKTDALADTVYFGGGTPTCVDVCLLEESIEKLFSLFNISEDAEVTMECNPKTIDLEGLRRLRKAGVNRLSIGLQSSCNEALRVLGRIHTFEDFCTCFENARKAGFENISLDLMYGLPGMTMADWEKTLDTALSFGAEHISAYALKIEEGTPFSKMELVLPNEDLTADMYERMVERLRYEGYRRYEISNFAKNGFESRHNLKYWECSEFLGLGAGAYSCMDGRRFSNLCSINEYIDAAEKGKSAEDWREDLSKDDLMSEFMFLGLRCEKGVSRKDFYSRFGVKIEDCFGAALKKYVDFGFILSEGDTIRFSDKGFFVSNTILSDFV